MLKKILFYVLVLFSVLIGLFPLNYFFQDRKFGLLAEKSDLVLTDLTWNIMFYTHIILGGISLLIGWIQFSKKIRLKRIRLHRNIGKIYVVSVLLSAISGIYIGFFATGGIVAKTGFICLGILWFFTTLKGFTAIKNKDVIAHQKMMIYSYAATFAAVTLRMWIPILIPFFGEFIPTYRVVAWLCWIPNIIVAHLIIKKQFKQI